MYIHYFTKPRWKMSEKVLSTCLPLYAYSIKLFKQFVGGHSCVTKPARFTTDSKEIIGA